jgi:hypothetical protein
LRIRKKTNDPVEPARDEAASRCYLETGDEWTWMVAEDPTSIRDERGGMPRRGSE